MRRFVHETLPRRVVFGEGSVATIADEAEALDLAAVLVISGGAAAVTGERVARVLGSRAAGRYPEIRQHVPEELVAEALEAARGLGVDGLCSVGGGSATGLAKALAVELALPILAVPTTYAGSEMTPIYGVTGERKRTGRDDRALPRTVVYDPEVTLALPARVSAASGLNAVAHAVGALLQPDADAVAAVHAEEALRVLPNALRAVVARPDDLPARGEALYGAFLAASALAAGTGRHHRLCHLLGGAHRLVHADLHAALLPHTLAYEQAHGEHRAERVSAALRASEPAAVLSALARDLGAPDLSDLALPAGVLEDAARRAGFEDGLRAPARHGGTP